MFSKGKSVSVFPLKVLFDFVENAGEPLKAGITVSSRKFKKAVHRNRVKRVLREAYRLQKLPLQQALQERQQSMVVFFIYLDKELPEFNHVHEKMMVALQKVTSNVINRTDKN